MIIVYRFASGFFDGTNLFGHASVAFTGLGAQSFGVSQVKNADMNATYSSDAAFGGDQRYKNRRNDMDWQTFFFADRTGHAFLKVTSRAYIISNQDLERYLGRDAPSKGGMDERKAYQLWLAESQKHKNDITRA